MRTTFRTAIGLLALASSLVAVAALADEAAAPTSRRPALVARMASLEAERLGSSDLRIRALHAAYLALDDERRPEAGVHTEEAIPAATLYEQARGSTDPLLLDLVLQRCPRAAVPRAACDRLDLARRWTEADTQNQVAWLTLSQVQQDRGDLPAAQASFARAASASQWHEHYDDAARLLAGTLPHDLSPVERYSALNDARGRAGAIVNGLDALQTLLTDCAQGRSFREPCLRIVQTMVRDTDSTAPLTMAPVMAVRAGADPATVARYQQTSDAVHWALLALASTFGRSDDAAANDDEARRRSRVLEAVIATGERRSADRILLEKHMREADAARLFVAGLSPEVLERRASMHRFRRDLRGATE